MCSSGEFHGGEIDGSGRKRWADGREYVGHFARGEPHGEGRMRAPTGEEYIGEFDRSQRHGTSICTCALRPIAARALLALDSTRAAFSARAGQGCLRSPDGTVYEGTFRHHKKHGAGFETSPCALLFDRSTLHHTYDYSYTELYGRTMVRPYATVYVLLVHTHHCIPRGND